MHMKSKLEDSGWWQTDFEGESIDDYLIDLSNSLGTPVGGRHKKRFIEILRPTPYEYAKTNSLSKKYSLTAFPFHCDTVTV